MPPDARAILFRTRAKVVACSLILAVVIIQWIRIFGRPYGDFELHYHFAEAFLQGRPLYKLGFHRPYPPFWAMAHVPLLLLPMHAAQVVLYPLGLIAGVVLTMLMRALTKGTALLADPASLLRGRLFWVVVLALLLSSRYLVRDLVECMANTWLVALTWLGIYAWRSRREGWAGLCLGLAIALKMTAALFVPYFLLKRQWKMAAISTLFALLFTVAPIVRYGPAGIADHLRAWSGHVIAGLTHPNPSYGINGEEPYNNMALRPAMARYLTRLPPGHQGRVESPAYVDVLSLPPHVAAWIIRAAMLALVAFAAWSMRRPVVSRDEPALLWECAAVSLLILLLSPITWGQHCAGVFPAMYLIADRLIHRQPMAKGMQFALGLYIIASLVLNRAILGQGGANLIESYRLETWAILAVFFATIGCARTARRALQEPAATSL